MRKVPVGIVGVSGYTGLELVKILLGHPHFELVYTANSEGETNLEILHPCLKGMSTLKVERADPKEAAQKCELLFLALPHKSAMEFAREVLALGNKVVDLSADYRLTLERYEASYCQHTDKENLSHAVYGLIEWARDKIPEARLIANPGCYPTATLLGILPFVPYLEEDCSIFIDAKSGVSGAGKKLTNNTHYPTINENLFAYSPLGHRHEPEIEEKIELFGRTALKVRFVPHLTPLTRGMLVSVFARLKEPIDALEILKAHYSNEPSIRIRETPVDIKSVAGTHFCDIYALSEGRDLWVNSAIDNLLRGASSQAVANANLMFGFSELAGLPRFAYAP
ncbi:MAG: N-acetyl-gamma-glutamyl-phosphate reductase [Wolinella sp.]